MTDKKQSAVARRLSQKLSTLSTETSIIGDQNLNNAISDLETQSNYLTSELPTIKDNASYAQANVSFHSDPTNLGGWEARILDLENNPSGGGGIDPTDPTQPILIWDNFIQQSNGDESGTVLPYSFAGPPRPTSSKTLTPTGLIIYEANSETDHIGIVQVTLEQLVGSGYLNLVNAPTLDSFVFDDLNTIYFIIKTENPTDSYKIKLGLFADIANPTQGIYFEGTSGANWVPTTDDGTASTGTTTALASSTWYTLKIQKKSATSVGFTVNTGTEVVLSTNIPTSFLTCGVYFENTTGSPSEDISFKLDFFSLKLGDVTPVLPTGTTVEGTTNEVEVTSVGSVYTVGLPDNVTITGTLTADDILSKISGPTVVDCKNVSGNTLPKGTPVYISGTVGGSGVIEVQQSFNDDPATMPAIGLLYTEIINNEFGHVVLLGSLSNVSTNIFTLGSTLYVDQTIGGNAIGLTQTRPTGVDQLVQNIGRVGRAQLNTGEILVTGAGRTNAIPNNVYLSNIVDGDATNPTTSINFYEDFFGNSTESGETGTHGWTVLNGIVAQITSESNHPGIIRFRGSTTANQVAYFSLSIASGINSFATSQLNMTNFIFKQVQTDTDTTRIFGCLDSMANTLPNGVYIRKASGSNDYFAVVRNSLAENTALLFTQDTAWKNIKITKVGSNYEFRVNGNSPVTVSPPAGNMPGTLTLSVLFSSTAGSLTRNVDLDFWSFKLSSMTR
jgi:hypothetical protein